MREKGKGSREKKEEEAERGGGRGEKRAVVSTGFKMRRN